MSHPKRRYYNGRGDCYGLVLVDEGVPETTVFAWVDCNRHYFIATRGSPEEGNFVSRKRWRHVVAHMNS